MKLAEWLTRSGVKRADFARRIGVSPGAVTQMCREDGAWASRETAQRIFVQTRGTVTPNFARICLAWYSWIFIF